MKQISVLFAAIILVLAFHGCSTPTQQADPAPSVGVPTELSNNASCPEIDETVIYDSEVLSITVTGMEYDSTFKTYVIKTNIQNHSQESISYSLNWANVNGYTISSLALGTVFGEKTASADFGLPNDELQLAGITSIQEISFSFEFRNADSDELICVAPANLHTSCYGEPFDEYSFDGTEAYVSDSYKILLAPYSEPSVTHPLTIYVENQSDHPLGLMYDGIALNDQMVANYMSGPYVLPHSRRIEVVTIPYFGNEPEIGAIESVSLSFELAPYRTDGSFSTGDMEKVPAVSIAMN